MKDALDESLERGMLNGRLKGFFDSALRAAKKVRRAVSGILEVKEIEATALDYISSKMDLDSARVVVLGSGKIGSAAAEMLKGCNVRVVHHGERIPHCDALICALSAQSPVVKRPRKGCVIVDLGMPPNCAPSAGAVSLDDLKNWRRAQTGAIDEAMALAEDVVASELKKSRICS